MARGCPLLRVARTFLSRGATSENDPACVKTRASRECAELFSPLSSLRLCCQCCSFPIQRNRDKISMRKFDVGIFTQPRPGADLRDECCTCPPPGPHHQCAFSTASTDVTPAIIEPVIATSAGT